MLNTGVFNSLLSLGLSCAPPLPVAATNQRLDAYFKTGDPSALPPPSPPPPTAVAAAPPSALPSGQPTPPPSQPKPTQQSTASGATPPAATASPPEESATPTTGTKEAAQWGEALTPGAAASREPVGGQYTQQIDG